MLIADGMWNAYDCPAPEDDRTIEEELDLLSTFTFAAREFAHRSGGHFEDDWAAEKRERAVEKRERAALERERAAVARERAALARDWVVARDWAALARKWAAAERTWAAMAREWVAEREEASLAMEDEEASLVTMRSPALARRP